MREPVGKFELREGRLTGASGRAAHYRPPCRGLESLIIFSLRSGSLHWLAASLAGQLLSGTQCSDAILS